MVAAHSGALAGEDGAYQALFDAYGVAQVATLDELADTCELLAGRRAHPGALAAIGDSGGERAHLLDLAEQLRVPFADISEATRQRLAAVLEPGLPPTNPLDAWGTGNDADQIFATCIQALLEDPATAALALNLDLTTEPTPDTSYTGLAIAAAASTTKPVAVLSNLDLSRRPHRSGHPPRRRRPRARGHRHGSGRPGAPVRLPRLPRPSEPRGLWTTRHPRHLGRLRSPTGGPARGRRGGGRPGAGRGQARPGPVAGPAGLSRGGRWTRPRGWPCWATGGCRWWRPRWRPAWRRRWPRPGGLGGRWC